LCKAAIAATFGSIVDVTYGSQYKTHSREFPSLLLLLNFF
jgi:hypothetical protein